jgi:prepilin-type N-terminal cleavage/methylation domain-containing protein
MRRATPLTTPARPGFTLVELLVVMGLILVLASLALMIIPSISSEQRATQGATQLQQWLESSKQRALRDRAPRGLRLVPGSTFRQVTDVQFLEQAPDYHLGTAKATINGRSTTFYSRAKTTGLSPFVTFDMFDPTNPTVLGANAPPIPLGVDDPNGSGADFPVLPGDSIELGGQIYRITSAARRNVPNPGGYLQLASTPPAMATINYRIIRRARPVGDEPMTLPQNIIIDLNRGLGYDLSYDPFTGAYDIMFAPDGRVVGMYAGLDKIILWVRDATVADNLNDPTLVVIYPRTGQIVAHPVDLSNYGTPQWQPYSFTTSGRRSSI